MRRSSPASCTAVDAQARSALERRENQYDKGLWAGLLRMEADGSVRSKGGRWRASSTPRC